MLWNLLGDTMNTWDHNLNKSYIYLEVAIAADDESVGDIYRFC